MAKCRNRSVVKPKRPSRSLETIRCILASHDWYCMITYKPKCDTEELANTWMETLYEQLKNQLRDTDIGFLIKREFGECNQHAHFHAVFTSVLSDQLVERLRKLFLRKEKLAHNRSRQFQYDCHCQSYPQPQSRLREYLQKYMKGSMDVMNPPKGWDLKELKRPYKKHRLKKSEKSLSQSSLKGDNTLPVTTTNWSHEQEKKMARSISANSRRGSNTDVSINKADLQSQKLPQFAQQNERVLNNKLPSSEQQTPEFCAKALASKIPSFEPPSQMDLMKKACANCWNKYAKYIPRTQSDQVNCSRCGEPWEYAAC